MSLVPAMETTPTDGFDRLYMHERRHTAACCFSLKHALLLLLKDALLDFNFEQDHDMPCE